MLPKRGRVDKSKGDETMKRTGFTVLALAAIAVATGPAGAQAGGDIAGHWRTDDGKAIITVAPCGAGGAQMCGRISRILVAQPAGGARDRNNRDTALADRPLLGVAVLSNLRRDGAAWVGSGYSPDAGRNFTARVTTDRGQLQVRGCVGPFCRTVLWPRA
jgi:uncharacterized protein (DUF2147 family)